MLLVDGMDMTKIKISKTKRIKGKTKSKGEEVKVEGDGWSDWIWDANRLFYYRARKGGDNVWQYEYAEVHLPVIMTEPEEIFVEEPVVEFLKVEEGVIFEDLGIYELEGGDDGQGEVQKAIEMPTLILGEGESDGVVEEKKASSSNQGAGPKTSRNEEVKEERQDETKDQIVVIIEESSEEVSGWTTRLERWRNEVEKALQRRELADEKVVSFEKPEKHRRRRKVKRSHSDAEKRSREGKKKEKPKV